MAANPLPLDGDRQLEEAGTYRNLEIVVLSPPPHCTKVFVVFVIYPGKSSPTVAINAARGFLAENDVKILNNQSEMRKRSEYLWPRMSRKTSVSSYKLKRNGFDRGDTMKA
jgi:hypothetical protein